MVKQQVRTTYKKKRNRIMPIQVKEWSEAVCTQLMHTDIWRQAEIICFYYPLGNEVNLLPAAQRALEMGKVVIFPKTEGDVIRFYQVETLKDFQEGCFHVMEPVSQQCFSKEDYLGRKTLILVPGVVFDEKKNRMGYGRGYYDRYMMEHTEAVKVGIAFEMQVADEIPVEKFDISMDYMVTEKRIW